jgi:type II secretory pathway component GspD/PulD (secretin)
MTLLTEGNKAIKHKDMSLKSAHERIAKLNQFIKQVSQLGNGKTLSIDAINSALSQQPTTIVMANPSLGAQPSQIAAIKPEDQFNELKTKIE